MKRTVVVFSALVLLPILSLAQMPAIGVVANIEFSFHAGGKLLPAGTYEIKPTTTLENVLSVTNTKTGQSIVVPIVTSISKKLPSEGQIVFDKAGTDYYLAEVYVPGMDGLLVNGAPGQHTHVSVKSKK